METPVGAIATFPCPYGPVGVNGTRMCVFASGWMSPNIRTCGTAITRQFTVLADDVKQVNNPKYI